MTPEEIADAQERRAQVAHDKYIATADAWLASIRDMQAFADAADARGERVAKTFEEQTRTGQAIAAELPRSQRLAILVDSATERLTDRTAAGGAADVPKSVAEAMAILAEVERQTAPVPPPSPPPPSPPPLDPPKPPGV